MRLALKQPPGAIAADPKLKPKEGCIAITLAVTISGLIDDIDGAGGTVVSTLPLTVSLRCRKSGLKEAFLFGFKDHDGR